MKPISIIDVARTAGVSTTTVSRVINSVPTVTEANRRRVEQAIAQLHFRPNVAAQRLASGRNDTIGLIIPRYEGIFRSYYALEVIKGIGTSAERLQVDLLLHITDGKGGWKAGGVGGALFVDLDGNAELLDRLMGEGVPCVVLNHFLEDLPISCVAVDNRTAAKQVVAYLVKLGHREIATITGDLQTQAGLARLDGYVVGMKEHGLTVKQGYIADGDFSPESGRRCAETLLARKDRPTAIFAASDEMALAVIETARRLRLRVPEDLSVVGFDDNPIAGHAQVPLTTIRQPLEEMGHTGLQILHQQMSGKRKQPVKITLPTQLVERQSCRQTWIEP